MKIARSIALALVCAGFAYSQQSNVYTVIPLPDLSATGELRFKDKQAPPHYVGFKAPASISANVIWTLPSADAAGCFSSNGSGIITITGCAGGGANTALSNLTSPTSINQNLIPNAANTFTLGSGSSQWSQLYAILGTFGGVVGGTNTVGQVNVYNASNSLPFTIVGAGASGAANLQIGNLFGSGALYPINSTTDLGLSGTPFRALYATNITSTGTTALQNLTVNGTCTGCGTGANTALSNLSSPTAINQNLIPNAANTFTLGSGAAQWSQLYSVLGTFGIASSTAGQLNVYNASNSFPFTIVGGNGSGGSDLRVGNLLGTGAVYPINGTTDLGIPATPFRNVYVGTLMATSTASGSSSGALNIISRAVYDGTVPGSGPYIDFQDPSANVWGRVRSYLESNAVVGMRLYTGNGVGTLVEALRLTGPGNVVLPNALTVSGSSSLQTVTSGTWNGSIIGVSYGGTGASTFAAHGVLIGAGTSALGVTSAGTTGQCFTSNGASADPTFQTCGAGGSGANTALSNLVSPTAINQHLLPGASNTYNLGGGSSLWAQTFQILGTFGGVVGGTRQGGQLNVYNALNSSVFVINGAAATGGADLQVGNVLGTGAIYPVNSTTDLGISSAPFRSLYVTNITAGGNAGQSGTITVGNGSGGTCTIVFTAGVKTGGTC